MALLGMRDVRVAFGGPPVLDEAAFSIERGERVCLLGRNGAGKSTLMKLLDGTIRPDQGEVVRQTGVTVARLEQEIPADLAGTAFDIAAGGLGDAGTLLAKYHDASVRVGATGDAAALRYCGMERRRGYSAPVTVRLAAAGWPLTIVTERGVTGFVVTEVTPAGSTSVSS